MEEIFTLPDDPDALARCMVGQDLEVTLLLDDWEQDNNYLMQSYHSKHPGDWNFRLYMQYLRNNEALDALTSLFTEPIYDGYTLEIPGEEEIVVQAAEHNQSYEDEHINPVVGDDTVNVLKTDGENEDLDDHLWCKDISISRGVVVIMIKDYFNRDLYYTDVMEPFPIDHEIGSPNYRIKTLLVKFAPYDRGKLHIVTCKLWTESKMLN